MADEEQCQVQIREAGKRTWYLLTPNATLTRLWIHAMNMPRSRAETYAAELRAANPTASVRVVPTFRVR